MPAAIRMANGYTYYPGGFNHAAREADWGGSSGNSLYGGSGRKLRTSPEDQYRDYMLSQGYVENTSGIYPNWKFVRKDVLTKLNAMAAKQKAVDTVKGAANAVVGTGKKVKNAFVNEGKNISTSASEELNAYNRKNWDYDRKTGTRTYTGNKLGQAAAVARGAIKGTTAYKVGKAAVGTAGKMLATAGRGIKTAAGAVRDSVAKEFRMIGYGGRLGRLQYDRKHMNEDGTQGGNVFGRTAATVGGAIAASKVGQAARKAGRTVLNAGGTVVKKVGDALTSIKEFFRGAYTKVRGKVARAFNKGKDYDSAIGPEKKDKK